jgi:hypothetical protein
MRSALQVASYLLWFPLIVLAITAVLRAGVRRYALIFTYLTASFLFAVMQIPAALAYRADNRHYEWLNLVFATGEVAATALVLAVVLGLIYRASSRIGPRRLLRLVLIAGSVLFMALSFLIHSRGGAELSFWIMPWKRDVNLCAAILDFALWTMLLNSRGRDPMLLLLTGGMGIMFAGDTIGDALRNLAISRGSNPIFMAGNIVTTLADSVFLFVWWQGFSREARQQAAARVAKHA